DEGRCLENLPRLVPRIRTPPIFQASPFVMADSTVSLERVTPFTETRVSSVLIPAFIAGLSPTTEAIRREPSSFCSSSTPIQPRVRYISLVRAAHSAAGLVQVARSPAATAVTASASTDTNNSVPPSPMRWHIACPPSSASPREQEARDRRILPSMRGATPRAAQREKWNGMLVTTTPGLNSRAPLIRKADWLWNSPSHQWAVTNSGRTTVT